MSELGAALVEIGDVEEGAALLDQAMAAALAGEGGDLDTVVLISCRTITTCSRAADLKRAMQWIRAADDFNRRHGSTHLYTTCRTHYGSVLFAVGDWQQAEEELQAALNDRRQCRARPSCRSCGQAGRTAPGAGPPRRRGASPRRTSRTSRRRRYARAALHLARGAPKAAISLVRRRLDDLGEEYRERAALLDLLVDALVAEGDHHDLAARLEEVAAIPRVDATLVAAYRQRALGRGMAALGEPSAVEHLEAALSAFGSLDMPYECGRTRLVLAQVLAGHDTDDRGRRCAGGARLLRAARRGPRRRRRRGRSALAGRAVASHGTEGPSDCSPSANARFSALLGEGLPNRDIAERLYISRKTVEHHVASILSKLGLSGRAEAAAYAVRHLERGSASE